MKEGEEDAEELLWRKEEEEALYHQHACTREKEREEKMDMGNDK